MRDEFVRAPLLGPEFDGALPPLEEITAENLAFDLEDAKKVPCWALCMSTKRSPMIALGAATDNPCLPSPLIVLRIPGRQACAQGCKAGRQECMDGMYC